MTEPRDERDLGGILKDAAESAAAWWANVRPAADAMREQWGDPMDGVMRLGEALGVDWQDEAAGAAEFLRSRMTGEYPVDAFGFDVEFTERVYLPLLRPLISKWFRVGVTGVENLPEGPALLVANHAGTLPLDSLVMQGVVHQQTERHLRMLGADLVFRTPFVADFARRTGSTYACQEDALRLLADGHLVVVFPEGFKGLGKSYAQRYRLRRFGRGGFVTTAVAAGVPIVPVSIVGSEEIYPILAEVPGLARLLGLPYFPLTPTFPWFGPLGAVPLPSKWQIRFGEPIPTEQYAGTADDPATVFKLTEKVRHTVQRTLHELLDERRGTFW